MEFIKSNEYAEYAYLENNNMYNIEDLNTPQKIQDFFNRKFRIVRINDNYCFKTIIKNEEDDNIEDAIINFKIIKDKVFSNIIILPNIIFMFIYKNNEKNKLNLFETINHALKILEYDDESLTIQYTVPKCKNFEKIVKNLLDEFDWDFKGNFEQYHPVMTGNCWAEDEHDNCYISCGNYSKGEYNNAPSVCSHCYPGSCPATLEWDKNSRHIILYTEFESTKLQRFLKII